MGYDEAKAAFFQELNYPEEELAGHIEAVAQIIRSHVEAVYLAESFDGKLQHALEQVIQTAGKAQEVAQALELPTQEQKYKNWQKQAEALFAQVGDHFTLAKIQLPILSGGERRIRHFLHTKLPMDSVIIAIENTLDILYPAADTRKNREYYGAGLLRYLGYEQFEGLLPDYIEKRYRERRRNARKYLTREAIAALMKQATQAVVDYKQKAAILTELLSK